MSARFAFGQELRRHRERRGIALELIEHETKIAKSLFASLERGDCSRWPGGIYSRAYVRDYARVIGLDLKETVDRFIECFETPDSTVVPFAPARRHGPPRGAGLRLTLAPKEVVHESWLMRLRVYIAERFIAFGEWLRGSKPRRKPHEHPQTEHPVTQSA